jgi:peptidyl-tRNA hydrolase
VAKFYKIEAKDILVIHDDIDLPVAKIQLKL